MNAYQDYCNLALGICMVVFSGTDPDPNRIINAFKMRIRILSCLPLENKYEKLEKLHIII